MKIVALVLLTLLLAGCTSTAVTVAHLVANGVSLMVTQKTVSDNAISLAMDQDCVMWRVLRNEYPCRDLPPDVPEETMIASAEPTKVGEQRDQHPIPEPRLTVADRTGDNRRFGDLLAKDAEIPQDSVAALAFRLDFEKIDGDRIARFRTFYRDWSQHRGMRTYMAHNEETESKIPKATMQKLREEKERAREAGKERIRQAELDRQREALRGAEKSKAGEPKKSWRDYRIPEFKVLALRSEIGTREDYKGDSGR